MILLYDLRCAIIQSEEVPLQYILEGVFMNINFAENFRKLRKGKDITQEKLAEELGVSGQAVSRWELGVCYPDLELLPAIANYFGVSVDTLLSNDKASREKELENFRETVYLYEGEERINYILEYCRKYPDENYYAYHLVSGIVFYITKNKEKTEKYATVLYKNAEKLLDTFYRDHIIMLMSAVCEEGELNKWLDMAPYTSFGRRCCLSYRASMREDYKASHIQDGLELFEHFAELLDRRCPDSAGPDKKSQFQLDVMRVVRSFGDGQVPDGWKMFYAYKQLVYSACLFGKRETEEGWKHFDSAIEMCKQVSTLGEEWLDIGGALFSNLKVDKKWRYAIDEDGKKHELFDVVYNSFYDMDIIYSLLTDPRWAWFNSVRDTEKYKAVVEWVKAVAEKQKEEN